MSAVPAAYSFATPNWLPTLDLSWQLMVGREQRPIGMRLSIKPGRAAADAPMAEILASVLDGLVAGGDVAFPHGLVLLSPKDVPLDASLTNWRPPRNVMLEIAAATLADETQVAAAADLQRHGVRLVLNAPHDKPAAHLPLSFQYVIRPPSAAATVASGSGVIVSGASSRAEVKAAFAQGAHAMIGWPLEEPVPEAPGTLQPVQKAALELIRLLQAEADALALGHAFAADPVLTYLLLTLANSPAFRRGPPISSVTQAITLLGYKRLLKWLVLLLVIASKGSRTLPQIYVAVARGFFMENLAEARKQLALRDDCFVTGAFSLLARITGIDPAQLFDEVALPETIVRAVTAGEGPAAPLLALARGLEDGARAGADQDVGTINAALLQALACANAMQNLV